MKVKKVLGLYGVYGTYKYLRLKILELYGTYKNLKLKIFREQVPGLDSSTVQANLIDFYLFQDSFSKSNLQSLGLDNAR